MIRLNNGMEIPQIGAGTWTLRDDVAVNNVKLALQFSLEAEDMEALNALNINLRSNKDNDPETFPW